MQVVLKLEPNFFPYILPSSSCWISSGSVSIGSSILSKSSGSKVGGVTCRTEYFRYTKTLQNIKPEMQKVIILKRSRMRNMAYAIGSRKSSICVDFGRVCLVLFLVMMEIF